MTPNDKKRYVKFLLISWFLFVIILVGLALFFSFHLKQMQETSVQHSQQIEQNTVAIRLNAEQVAKLEKLVNQLAEQNKVPGPQGDRGDDGKDGADSISTHTEVVKEIPVKGDKGDPFTFEDLTEEQKAELRGADALGIELCKWRDRPELGWRYIGTTICLPVEVVE